MLRFTLGSATTAAMLCSTALVMPTIAQAQETAASSNIEEILITATRSERNLSDVPRSVTIINSEDLQAQLDVGFDIDELLGQLVPGMGTSVQGRLNSSGQNQIRGRRLQLVVDGVVQNNGFLDFSEEFISFESENIERIEVIRGGSAVYGFGAGGGIIAMSTKRPVPGEVNFTTKVSLSFQGSNFDESLAPTIFQDGSYSSGDFDIRVGGSFRRHNNTFDGDGNRRPSDFNLDDTKDFSLFGTVGFNIDTDQRLEFNANYFKLEEHQRFLATGGNSLTDIPAGTVEVPVGISNTAILDRLPIGQTITPEGRRNQQFQLRYTNGDIFGSSLEVMAYYLDRFSPTDFLIYNTGVPLAERPIGRNEGRLKRAGGRITIDTPLDMMQGGNVLWGIDYETSDYKQPNTAGIEDITPPIDQDAVAGFIQLDVQLIDNLRFSGGIRYEDISVDIPTFTVSEVYRAPNAGNVVDGGSVGFDKAIFNAGLVFDIAPTHHVFADFSQGFTTGEILRAVRNTSASSVETAVELQPQVIDNFEIGLRGTFDDLAISYSMAGFYSKSDLGVTFVFDPVTDLSTVERAPERVWGFEATIDAEPTEQLGVGGTISWQEGEQELAGGVWEPLPNQRISPFKLTAYASYQFTEWASGRIQGLYTGSRDKFPGSNGFGEGDVTDQFLMDISGRFNVGPGTLTAAIQNVLDEQYIPPSLEGLNRNDRFFAGPGRTFTLTYKVDW